MLRNYVTSVATIRMLDTRCSVAIVRKKKAFNIKQPDDGQLHGSDRINAIEKYEEENIWIC